MAKVQLKQSQHTKETFSLCFTAAMSQDEVISMQLLDGNQDSVIFENFVYCTFKALRDSDKYEGRQIVAFIDNARIHKKAEVISTLTRLGVDVIFNAPYTPYTMPVEALHSRIKQHLRNLPARPTK